MPKFVQMPQFGNMGRFGNQLLQYAYLDMVARRTGATLRMPPWVGNALFGLSSNPVVPTSGVFLESSLFNDDQTEPPRDAEILNRDFKGYAQYHTGCLKGEKDHIRKMFTPTFDVFSRLQSAANELLDAEVTGVHIRRGDYGQSIFPIIPIEWYVDELRKQSASKLFVASEDMALVDRLSEEWEVVTASSLGVSLSNVPLPHYNYEKYDLKHPKGYSGAMDFYADFYLLSHCKSIMAPSSSFSFAAAMLNRNLDSFKRASLEAEGFVEVDPWSGYPLLRENVKDYPHIKGIALASNPYWST